MQYGWRDAPDVTRLQVEAFVRGCHAVLGEDMTALYLHGSLAMGCFNPASSDIDLLVISERPLSAEDRYQMAEAVLAISGSPHPLEMSVVARDDLRQWQHPFPYEFHYGEGWLRVRYQAARDDPDFWESPQPTRTDADLAAHFVITRERGIALVGEPPRKLLPEIPIDDYIDSILGDFDDAVSDIQSNPVYGVLNLCRVYWFLLKNAIASKDEAGEWALSTLPDEYRPVVSQALREYRGGQGRFDAASLHRFVHYIDVQVRELLS